MVLSMSGQGPAPGEALGLTGAKLGIAVGISMVLGALMMLGIGFYGPCLIMISLLGMDPRVSYPIMMGACAFLMPSGSIQFIRKGSYDLRTAIAFLIAGPLAVLIAAPLVDKIPLFYLRILVLVVVLYTAIRMLMSAAQEKAAAARVDSLNRRDRRDSLSRAGVAEGETSASDEHERRGRRARGIAGAVDDGENHGFRTFDDWDCISERHDGHGRGRLPAANVTVSGTVCSRSRWSRCPSA